MASDGVEVASTPEEPQSVSRPVSCGKEPVWEPRKKSPEARSTAGKKYRKRRLSPKPKSSKSKRKKSKRLKFVYSSSPSSDTSKTSGKARERPELFPGYQCPTRHSSVVRKSPKPRLADSENAVQGFRARNKEALSTERKITQGTSPVLERFPGARAGLPSLQPTAV